MGTKSKVTGFLVVVSIILSLILGDKMVETVEKGTYQIKQAAVTGDMTAHMNPGMYLQMFGDIQEWPKSETFFFTSDNVEGGEADTSIQVRFADGSETRISGTLRVSLPASGQEAIALVVKHGYRSYQDMEARLILPILRKALINSANMMTARESYAEKKSDYFIWVRDQIEYGMYITEGTRRQVPDPTDPTGEKMVWIKARTPKVDDQGNFVREANHPLAGTGITLVNFEVKRFDYPERVDAQIAEQQKNLMAIATAKSNAEKAKQDAITAEELGKASVMTAKYEKEVIKERAIVEAQMKLEVAQLDKQAAKEIKQKLIFLGEGESERKRLVMEADGALQQKLDAYVTVNAAYAEAMRDYKGDWVPQLVMGGSGGKTGGGNGAQDLISLLSAKAAKDLSLDLKTRTLKVSK